MLQDLVQGHTRSVKHHPRRQGQVVEVAYFETLALVPSLSAAKMP